MNTQTHTQRHPQLPEPFTNVDKDAVLLLSLKHDTGLPAEILAFARLHNYHIVPIMTALHELDRDTNPHSPLTSPLAQPHLPYRAIVFGLPHQHESMELLAAFLDTYSCTRSIPHKSVTIINHSVRGE